MTLAPLLLTLQLATVTTFVLLLLGTPLAYWLAFSKARWKFFIETLVSLPLVLPPSVIGFYLLVLFNPNSSLGRSIEALFGLRLVFSFAGLVMGSTLFSLPFMIAPVQQGFAAVPTEQLEAASMLGSSQLSTFFRVIVPASRASLLTGAVMSFAHTVGEFGVVLMLGGNIPGETRTASIAIYTEVEAMNYDAANLYALLLLSTSFVIVLSVKWLAKVSGAAVPR